MLVSIVIPTYQESKLHETLKELDKQTIFTTYPQNVEIIIADFDPEKDNQTWHSFTRKHCVHHFLNGTKTNTKFVKIDRKGIAYARHQGILASSGQIVVNFDADARFTTNNGIEKLIQPILDTGAVCTCCDNIFDNKEFNDDLGTKVAAVATYEALNNIQREAMIVTLEPGFTFTRHAYDYAGGFFDVNQAEAIIFSPKLIYNFGLFAKRHVDSTAIIVSPRRVNAMNKYGILNILNYDNAFRFNKLINIHPQV